MNDSAYSLELDN